MLVMPVAALDLVVVVQLPEGSMLLLQQQRVAMVQGD
jgi:hypothetical protein